MTRRHDQRSGGEGAEEASEQIVDLADPGGADERAESGLVVAEDDVGDEGGGHEQEEERDDEVRHDDRMRGVEQNVPAAAGPELEDRHVDEGGQEEGRRRRDEQADS